MKLTVVSHKLCWQSDDSASGYATDGGFPLQMKAISELFSETKILVPCENAAVNSGLTKLEGNNLNVCPLARPGGEGLKRKINMLGWLLTNGRIIWREVRRADAVHAPIPGDVGTIGMLFALVLKKPLFVRHCGNWLVQRTLAEHFWKWIMERLAGGRNVMLATGGAAELPSKRNPNLKWIFSTSLRKAELIGAAPRELPPRDDRIKLIIACRQEKGKGTDIVIAGLPAILEVFPNVTLDVVGGGAALTNLKEQAAALGLEERVVFHGKVEQSRVVALLKEAHLFCYPTASEGFPKVVLEALASGLPVVTTKVSVLPQLIGAGGGVLLDEASVSAVVEAVKGICSDRAAYNRMSAAAIATAQKYSLENWRDYIGETLRESWKVSSLSATS